MGSICTTNAQLSSDIPNLPRPPALSFDEFEDN
jgi:hypothetical protein